MKRIMLTISAAEWDGIQHRPHHFMRRCSQTGWDVLYVEPPATLLAPFKNKQTIKRWENWRKGVQQKEKGVYVVAPPPTLPFGNKLRWINKINQWMISRSVRKAIKAMPHKGKVDVYTFLPNTIDLLPLIEAERVIYDCVDDHASFTGLINVQVVHQMEKELMAKAQVSFATAKRLMEDRKGWSENLHVIPNGAEIEHFSKASDPTQQLPTPPDLEKIGFSRPIVGFYGGISDWIDVPLLTQIAKQLPNFQFVLIGPVATSVEELKKLPNVSLLGAKPYTDLPQYLQHFTCCLIPFRITKLTESVNPVKLFEYLAAGKPIVSTPLPEVLAFSENVAIAATVEDSVEAIKGSIQPTQHTEEVINKRKGVARENAWDARWERAQSLIEQIPTTP